MAIANKNDLTHVVRTTQQWESSYDKYECIPEGVLCIEFTTSGQALAKIGNGRDIFSKLPYIGGADLTNYFTKEQTTECINDILKAKRYICIKGILNNKNQLPTNATCGDLYFVISQNQSSSNKYDEYVYSPSNTWENLGSIPIDIDLSEYAKIVYVDEKIDEVNERIDDIEQHGTHTHANKDILDLITAAFTAEEKDKLSTLYNYDDTELRELITQASHTHSNKDILDAISAPFTKEDKSKLDQLNPYDDSILKEKIQALERLAHEHSNKRILDRTTASFTTEYERKMRWIRLYTGCTGMEEGIAGLVPAAQAGEEDYVLSGSGEWVPQTGGGGTYELPIATTSTLGGIKVGDGLEIDANGKLSVVGGGGGGDSIAEGDGITITTDPQTGVKTISVNTGDHLEVDENTGELNVTDVDYEAGQGIHIGADYTLIEYIKNSGNYDQIILTDIIPNFSDKIEIDMKIGAAVANTVWDEPIFGCNGSTPSSYRYSANVYLASNDSNISCYNHFTYVSGNTGSNFFLRPSGVSYDGTNAQRQTLTMAGSTATLGNVSKNFSNEVNNSFIDPQIGIAIFGNITDGGTKNYFNQCNLTVYGVKLYDSNNTLIHDLRPAERGIDGEAGLYDLVTHKFYGNVGNGSFVKGPPVSSVDDRLISAKIGNGLQFDSNDAIEVVTGNGLSVNQDNELEVNTGDGLQINQDGEVEIDPSIIPDVPEYRAGKAILIDSYSSQLTPTDFSNTDFITSITGVTAGTITKSADNSSITIATWGSDCYTSGSGGGSAGSYSFTVKPSTKYRMEWEVTNSEARNRNMIFENSGFDHVYAANTSYDTFIEFTTTATANSITTRLGLEDANVTQTFSNINLYEVLEETLEYDTISVSYKNGLKVNEYNQLEVNVGNGLYIDHSQIDPTTFSVQNQKYFFDEINVTATINGSYGPRSFIKLYTDDCLFALCDVLSGGNHYNTPILVGLTADSVKIRVDGSYGTSSYGPNITFDYRGKTWYCTSGYGITNSDMTDQTGTLQSLPTVYEISTEAEYAIIGKDLIDTAILLPDPDVTTVNAKLGSGLSFDANGAIQADAQPLSPATDSTLGGVIVGDGILVDADGTISVDPTIIPEITEYEAGTAISIEEVEHGGVTFDAWDSGTGWENVCYQASTGNAVVTYTYEAHSPISNSYTIPVGATRIRAIAYDQNDTMLWTSFSWIDSNNYHFASTSPEDGHYNDWFEIPTGAVKVNFGVSHSKLNNTTAMSLNDIKSVDITVQTVSEIEVDVWNGGTGWLNGDYTSGNSDSFATNWYYTYHYNYQQYIEVPAGATHVMVRGISNENDSHFEGGGCNAFDSNHHHVHWWGCAWEWHEISSDVKYVQPNVKWNNNNTRTISAANIKSVTLAWKLPALETNTAINVKYGNGLTVNQNNELELTPAAPTTLGGIKIGSGFTYLMDGTLNANPAMQPFEVGTALELLYDDPDALPTGYAHVDYVSSNPATNSTSSTNYGRARTLIDYTPENVTKLEIKMARDNDYQDSCFIGCRVSGSENQFVFWHENRSPDMQVAFVYGSKTYGDAKVNVSYVTGQVQEIEANIPPAGTSGNITVSVNGNVVKTYAKTGSPLAYKLGIFQSNRANEWEYQISNGRIYYLRLYEGDTLAVNLIPAVRLADEVVGFYDNVNDKFYTSSTDYPFTTDMSTIVIDGAHRTLNAKYNNGLMLNQNNELEVNIGTGLEFDQTTGAINVTGGGGGDTIVEGDGISITDDLQTGDKIISVNYGDGLTIDPVTGALMFDGQLPEGTIIKKLTYMGDGGATNNIQFEKKPIAILSIYGAGQGTKVSSCAAPIDAPVLNVSYGTGNGSSSAGMVSCTMSYNDTTNVLSLTGGNDPGVRCNMSGETYTVYYLIKGHTEGGTSATNEVSVIKTISYTGTGTSTNNIQLPETPDYILGINGRDGVSGDMVVFPFDPIHATPAHQYIYTYCYNSGISTNYFAGGHGEFTFNSSTNILTLTGGDQGAACNYLDRVYYVRYVVNEVIPSQTAYEAGTAISIETIGGLQPTNYSNDDFVDSIASMNAGSIVKAADKSSFTLTASNNDCYTRGSSGQANGSYPFNVKASTKYRFAWDSADPTVHGKVYTYENGLYDAMMHEIDQYDSSYLEFTTSANTTFIQARFGVMYAGDSITYSNVRLYEVIEDEDQYNEISVKYNKGLSVNQNNELEVNIGTGLSFDANGAIQVTGGGGGSGDTVAEGAGIEITTDQQTGNKVIAVNPGSGLQVNQTTNELEVSSGVVTSIAPTQNTPGSITVTEGDGTATPVSVISQMGGATSSTAGTAGYVPAPSSGDDDAYLRGDGTWDDSVVTEDDELTLVFVPDDYQPS